MQRVMAAAVVPCVVAIATLAAATGPARAANVEVDMMCPITEVVPASEGRPMELVIGRGAVHGLQVGARGDVWAVKPDTGHGADVVVARGELVELGEETARVRVLDTPGSQPERVTVGAHLELRALWPDTRHRGVLLECWLDDIVFLDNSRQPLVDARALMEATTPEVEARALEGMVQAGHEVVEFTVGLGEPLKRRRFAGKTIHDILPVATPDDYRAFLRFVQAYPGKYIGNTWKISETFATWLMNDAPPAPGDHLLELREAKDTRTRHAVIKAMTEMEVDELFEHAKKLAEGYGSADLAEAAGLAKTLDEVARLRKKLPPEAAAERAYIEGILLCLDPKARVKGAAAHRKAAGLYEAAKRPIDAGVSYNRGASCLFDAERYDEALAAFAEARAYAVQKQTKTDDPQVSAAMQAREAFAQWAVAQIAQKRGDYRKVVDELGPVIDNYRMAGYRGSRARELDLRQLMAKAYRKLGEHDQAKAQYEAMERIATELGDSARLAQLAWDVGDTWWDHGRYQEAAEHFERSARIARDAGDDKQEAKAIAAAAQALWNLGKLDEAVARHEAAMALRERRGDKSDLAWQLVSVGEIRKEMGDRDEARRLFDRALALRRELGERAKEAEVLRKIGDLELALKRLDKAREAFGEARRIVAELKLAPDEAGVLQDLARVEVEARDLAAAGRLIGQAVAIYEKLGNKAELGPALVWEARVVRGLGERDQAKALLERALALATDDAGLRVDALEQLAGLAMDAGEREAAAGYGEQGMAVAEETGDVTRRLAMLWIRYQLASMEGRYDDALALSDQRIALAREAGNRPQLTSALTDRAWQLTSIGRLEEARKAADEAVKVAEQNGDPAALGWALNALSRVEQFYGNLSEELALLDRAVKAMEEAGWPYGLAGLVFNRSLTLVNLRDLDRALAENARAERIAGRTATAELRAAILMGRGWALGLQGKHAEAEKVLREALAVARAGVPERVPRALQEIGRMQALQGRNDAALATLEEAVKLQEKLSGRQFSALAEKGMTLVRAGRAAEGAVALREAIARAEARKGALPWEPLYWLGVAQSRDGESAEAVATLRRAVKEIERGERVLDDKKALRAYLADKLDVYYLLVKLLLAQGKVEESLEYLERAKSNELSEVDRKAGTADTPEARLGAELEAQESRLQALVDEELAKEAPDEGKLARLEDLLAGVRQRRASFIESLDRQNALYDRYSVRPMQLEQLQAALPEGTLVVSPVVMDDRLVVFALTSKAITHFEEKVGADELRRLVDAWLAEVDTSQLTRSKRVGQRAVKAPPVEESLARLQKTSERLYDLLLRRAFDTLGTPRELVVSASGVLRYLPFAALHDGRAWVAERVVVTNMTALNQQRLAPDGEAAGRPTLLALADPDGSLPGARREVEALKGVFADAMVYTGDEASYTKLRQLARKPGFEILHLATHGILDAANPQDSNILLASRSLRYADIPALQLDGTRMVVLSACDTAVRAGGSGVEIAGIAYQFQRTRVDSVVATLWQVDDAATSELMTAFYGHVREGTGPAEALALAQRAALGQVGSRHRHPAFWAAFVLLGTP